MVPTPIVCSLLFRVTLTTSIYSLSLHDALPISAGVLPRPAGALGGQAVRGFPDPLPAHVGDRGDPHPRDRVEQRSEEHTSELQSRGHLVCRLLLEKKK